MGTIFIVGCGIFVWVAFRFWLKRRSEMHSLKEHSITPEALHGLRISDQNVLVFDVRQPLDLLADAEIIPGATWIPPQDVLRNPRLIPGDRDVVVYCTCPGDKTARRVLRQALAMQLTQVKFLTGGLQAWKAKGYTVVPYGKPFHLDMRS